MAIDPRLENAPRTGRKVNLVDARGNVSNVDARDAMAFVQSGRYSVATQQDISTALAAGKTSGIGLDSLVAAHQSFNRGLIDTTLAIPKTLTALGSGVLGVADPLRDISGAQVMRDAVGVIGETVTGVNAEALSRYHDQWTRGLAQDHGLATGVGRVGGELAGLAIGGLGRAGVALGTRAAAATGSRALGLAAAGGFEGALLGAGQASEQAFIADEALTSEKVLAQIGMGALLGGSLGGGLGAFSTGASKLYRAAKAGLAGAEAPSLAGAVRDFGRGRAIKALGFQKADLRKVAPKGASAEQIERKIAQIADESEGLLSKTGDLAETADNVSRAHQAAGQTIGKIRDKVDDLIRGGDQTVGPSRKAILDEIEQKVLQPASQNPDSLTRAKVLRDAERLSSDVRQLGPNPTIKQVTDLKKSLWDNQINEKTMGIVQAKAGTEHLQQIARVLEDHASAAVEKGSIALGEDMASQYLKAKMTYGALSKAKVALGKATAGEAGNRFLSLSDNMMGAAGFAADLAGGSGLGSLATGAISAGAHKIVRERSSAILANAAFKLARKMDRKVDRSLGKFFKVAAGEKVTPRLTKTQAAAVAAGVAPSTAFFLGKEKDPQKAYEQRVKELQVATANYGGGIRTTMQERFGGIQQDAPGLYTQMTISATRGAEFLKTKMPTPLVDRMSMTPRTSKPRPSSVELAEFARYYQAVADPMSVMGDLERGMATHEQIEALQNVYPKLYAHIRDTTLEKIRDADLAGKPINFRARQQLDMLLQLGGAGDPMLSDGFADRVQQAAQMVAQSKQPPQQGRPPSPEIADSMKTTGQELLG